MERDIENLVIPQHVALILDGNGRWAKKRGLPRTVGHKQGCVTVEQTVEDAARTGNPLSDGIWFFNGKLEAFC